MANQIIGVEDISVVKTVNGTKQLLSLRNQKVKKGDALYDFKAGSFMTYNGDLYMLKENKYDDALIIFTVLGENVSFGIGFSKYCTDDKCIVDWGDGVIESTSEYNHTYSDGLNEHEVVIHKFECSIVKYFRCIGIQISSLDISRAEPNLTQLELANNNLNSLDLSKNPSLIQFNCLNNKLSSLNIESCPNLAYFYCDNNPLTEITCSLEQEMNNFSVSDCLLSELNPYSVPGSVVNLIMKNNRIFSFDMADLPAGLGNKLRYLDLSDNTSLNFVAIEEAKNLSILRVDRCTSLQYMDCSYNAISTLSFSGCTSLKELYCAGNNISSTYMKVIDCPNLEAIDFSGNPFILDQTELKNFANSLPDRTGKKMGHLLFNSSESSSTEWIQSICDSKNWGIAIRVPDFPGGDTPTPSV